MTDNNLMDKKVRSVERQTIMHNITRMAAMGKVHNVTMHLIILFSLALTLGLAARTPRHVLFGPCYDIKTPTTLDLKTWAAGRWFEVRRYENEFEKNTDCATQVYFLNEDSGKLDISFTLRLEDGAIDLLQGVVTYKSSDTELLMNASFPHDSTSSSFDILATDIDNYAIVYSCWQVSNGSLPEKQERLWVLSRTPAMTNETTAIVDEALVLNGSNIGRYCDLVAQENCP